MGLLLQSENVHMALKKSLVQVSGVMRADLERLIDEIEINPESSEPYYSFLEEFDVPEVHSTVGMLYSISQGSSANTQQQIKELAIEGAKLLKQLADETEGNFSFEYSPESFHGTEVEYAVEVCNAVLDIWQPTPDNKVIINLPVTVEMSR